MWCATLFQWSNRNIFFRFQNFFYQYIIFAACHCWHLVRSVSPCQYVDPWLQYRCRVPLGQDNAMVWVLTLQLGGGTNSIDWISHGSSESTPLLVTLILVTSFLSSLLCWGLTTGCWHFFMDNASQHQTELCSFFFVNLACLLSYSAVADGYWPERRTNIFFYWKYICLWNLCLSVEINSVIMTKNSSVAYNGLNNVFMLQVSQEHSAK